MSEQTLVKTSPKALKAKKAAKKAASPGKPAPSPSSKEPTQSRSAFIRSLPATLKAADVVAKGKDAGLSFRTNLVYEVRRTMKKKGGEGPPAVKRGPGRPPLHKPTIAASPKASGGPARLSTLSDVERKMVGLVFEVGIGRARQLLEGVRAFAR